MAEEAVRVDGDGAAPWKATAAAAAACAGADLKATDATIEDATLEAAAAAAKISAPPDARADADRGTTAGGRTNEEQLIAVAQNM